MSISNKQVANQTTFNAAFVSRSSEQTITGGKEFVDYIATNKEDIASASTIAALSSDKSFVKITGSTATELQGIVAGANGQNIVVYNGTNQIVTLKHNSGSATAANRLKLPSGADIELGIDSSIDFIYDSSQSLWVRRSFSSSSSGSSAQDSSLDLNNLAIAASVASNAMTISLKTKAGADPSVSDIVNISFRSSTVTSGVYNVRSVNSSLSATISSGSTLGSTNGNPNWVYVYAIDNAGTVELAFCGSNIGDEGSVISTTAEGGSGAADSKTVLYSASARTNVPFRLIGRIKSTQATAGTWATSPSEISIAPFFMPQKINSVRVNTSNGRGSTNTCIRRFTTVVENIGSAITYADSASLGASFTINEDGIYFITADIGVTTAAARYMVGISKDTTQGGTDIRSITASDRLTWAGINLGSAGSGNGGSVSWSGFLPAGSVIRHHGNTDNPTTAGECSFSIVKG